MRPDISLILPAYNEAGTIARTIAEAVCYFEGRQYSYEIIVSADGVDGTREIVSELGRANSSLRVIGGPERRGKGYGRTIMNAAENWLREAGVPKLQLMVRRENAKAGAFYRSIGYEEQQTIVFGKWLDGREPKR